MLDQKRPIVCGLLVIVLIASAGIAQKPAADNAAAERATHLVTRSPFRVDVKVKGVFEAAVMAEVSIRPDVWTGLAVTKAVEQGTTVKKGQPLVWLETKKIDQKLKDLQYTRELSDLSLKQADEALQYLKGSYPLDVKDVERANEIAGDDLQYFLKVQLAQRKKSVARSLKYSQYSLEYAQEELDQLEKMYKADDLTEETEEIILKRARRSVESAQYSLESSKIRNERTLKTDLPREEEQLREAAERQSLALEKSRFSLPAQVRQKEIELAKLIHERKKSDESYGQLKKDRNLLIINAPKDGIVYYGSFTRGKWSGTATVEKQLRPGGTLSPNQVFMTIVRPRPMFVRVDISEKDLRHVRVGVPGKVSPTAFPDLKLSADVDSVSRIPISPGTFDCRIRVDLKNPQSEPIVPGMSCNVNLTAFRKDNALSVPSSAVFADETDEGKQFVYLVGRGGTYKKRPVVLGRKTDTKTEILEGLQEGDRVLLKKP